jgi:hypothetical protein
MEARSLQAAPAEHLEDLGHLIANLRAPFTDQLVSVRSIAQGCAQDPSPKIREQAGTLQAAADRMQAAFHRRALALAAESACSGQLQEQKIQTVETCQRISNRLSELYPNQWNRVRSYFRRPRRGARPTEEAMADPVQAARTAPALVPAAGTTASPVLASRQGQGDDGEVAKLVGLAP